MWLKHHKYIQNKYFCPVRNTSVVIYVAGICHGGNALWWQSWSHRGNSDRPMLFYGWQSLGEGLSLGEEWDVMFMQSRALSWVGQQVQLNANALSLWKAGDWLPKPSPNDMLKLGDLDIPIHIYLCQCWLGVAVMIGCHGKTGSRLPMSAWRSPGILTRCHTMTETRHHNVARIMGRFGKTCGQQQPQHLHLCWSMGLRVTEVQCQLPHWCHNGPKDLEAPCIHTMADAKGSLEATCRLICQSSRTRTRRTLSLIKIGIGI